MSSVDPLHAVARDIASTLSDPDKKQLRFNEIIAAARDFYADPSEGVREMVGSCDRGSPEIYVSGAPMWQSLMHNYQWMKEAGQ